jgi:hypothetical protein
MLKMSGTDGKRQKGINARREKRKKKSEKFGIFTINNKNAAKCNNNCLRPHQEADNTRQSRSEMPTFFPINIALA